MFLRRIVAPRTRALLLRWLLRLLAVKSKTLLSFGKGPNSNVLKHFPGLHFSSLNVSAPPHDLVAHCRFSISGQLQAWVGSEPGFSPENKLPLCNNYFKLVLKTTLFELHGNGGHFCTAMWWWRGRAKQNENLGMPAEHSALHPLRRHVKVP